MRNEPRQVLDLIKSWQDDPEGTQALVRDGQAPPVKLPPQITWVMLGLLRYQQRRRWARKMLRRQLQQVTAARHQHGTSVRMRDLLHSGATGIIASKPEWSFTLSGTDSFLSNRATSERLHVDLQHGLGELDLDTVREDLVSRRQPRPIQRRLLQLFPGGRGMLPAIFRLRDAGIIHVMDSDELGTSFKLRGVVDAYNQPVRAFLKAWSDSSQRAALAELIGDYAMVAETAQAEGDTQRADEATAKAAESQRRWVSILRREAQVRLYGELLWALVAAEPKELPDYLSTALDDPRAATAALEIVGGDPAWRPRIESLMKEAWSGPCFAHLREPAAFALARCGVPVKPLLKRLMSRPECCYSALLLALEFGPEYLLRVIRRGLRSPFRPPRLTAAAMLALLDTDQSRRELLAALEDSDDPDLTVECRTALLDSPHPDTHRAVREWEAVHPEAEESDARTNGNFYQSIGGCERLLREEMLEMDERVHEVRDAVFKPVNLP